MKKEGHPKDKERGREINRLGKYIQGAEHIANQGLDGPQKIWAHYKMTSQNWPNGISELP